jgi:tetratricopeptide (TPR) repeat protein
MVEAMVTARPALIGRERHLRELRMLVEGAVTGRGSALVLAGEAGVGKTRLAEEGAYLAEAAGARSAWAACWDASEPLSVWSALLAAVDPQAPVSMPAPPGSEADREGARAMWTHALVAHLEATVASRPTLLIVDDVQWCDPLSLFALEVLGTAIRRMPVALLLTLRVDGDPAPGVLDRVIGRARRLIVPPLTIPELAELAAEVTGRALTPAAANRLHDRTAGNVLYARELLANNDAESEFDTRALATARASALFDARLAALSPSSLRTLQTASVIGRRFRLDVLAETTERTIDALLELLEEGAAGGIVRGAGVGAHEFTHPLLAEACYASAGLPQRVRLHRDVGEAMERLRARGIAIAAVELAHHFADAAAAGVATKAVQYAAAAGRESMDQLGYEDAARDFARALAALDLCPADDATRADLLLDLGDAHAGAGDLPAARAAYESAATLARTHRWHERLARAALGVGSGPGGFEVPAFDRDQIALLQETLATSTGARRAQVLARLSVALSLDPDSTLRARLSEEAMACAREAGDPLALGYSLASWCDVIAGPADVDRRLDATAEILACATTVMDTRLELLGRRLRVVALLEAGEVVKADEEIAAFADRADRLGQVVYSWYVPLWRAMRAVSEGRLATAAQLRHDAERLGALAHSENAAMLTGSQLAMLRCELGDADAIAFFEDVMVRWPGLAAMARPGLSHAYAAAGEMKRAREVLAVVDLDGYSIDALGSEWLPSVVMLAYAAALTSTDNLTARLYSAIIPFRARHAIDGIGCYDMGSVERALGMLAAADGDLVLAAEHFDAALRQHRRTGERLLIAGTLRDASVALGDPAMLHEARELYAALGIDPMPGPVATSTSPGGSSAGNVFRREGDGWMVGLAGSASLMRDTKGMHDLARLLAQPGTDMHVLDLVAEGPTLQSDAPGDPIDTTARNQYRARLVEIERDLADADDRADIARSERLGAERDALIAELTSAYGLGGRARRRSDSAERARSAVTQRIRDAIARIEAADPGLGGHLRRAVRTGTFCAYAPEQPTTWEL